MTPIKGYLIERDERSLFIRDLEEASWAMEDSEYTVTALVPIDVYRCYENVIEHRPQTDETQERLELLEQIYELEEQQISSMKAKLEEAVELVESIHEFASKQTSNIMESRGLLLLIAESCQKWLKPKE
jgi:hypothetical protein